MKALSEILKSINILETRGTLPGEITGVTYDSRKVGKDSLFIALRGQRVDGHNFIQAAKSAGANSALVEEFRGVEGLCQIRVDSTQRAMADVAASFYDHPAQTMTLIGITGANGKTSSAYLTESILQQVGKPVGLTGTVEYRWPGVHRKAGNTTPLSLDLHEIFAEMRDASVEFVVMEVSSHSLMLDRVRGLEFQSALFTNLTQDHLDFHGNMEEYQRAKEKLFFEHLASNGMAVLNVDDPAGRSIALRLPHNRVITYGLDQKVDLGAEDLEIGRDGIKMFLRFPDQSKIFLHSPLLGRHNVYNFLGVAGLAYSVDIEPEAICAGIEALRVIPGRLEEVPNDHGFKVLVDYSHTEDALRKALETIRQIPHQRIITVMGAGGDRDKTKRPKMGAASAELSDWVVVTSDNPRTEEPRRIIKDIEAGMLNAKDRYEVIIDRAEAIRYAIHRAEAGDILLIAGKGHETTQTFADHVAHFDDREEATAALKDLS